MVTDTKEPWQMTREEYRVHIKNRAEGMVSPRATSRGFGKAQPLRKADVERMSTMGADEAHRHFIKLALSEGKPIPKTVLKDYPDLMMQHPAQKRYTQEMQENFAWEKQQKDVINDDLMAGKITPGEMDRRYKRVDEEILRRGKTVSESITKDYPELAEAQSKTYPATFAGAEARSKAEDIGIAEASRKNALDEIEGRTKPTTGRVRQARQNDEVEENQAIHAWYDEHPEKDKLHNKRRSLGSKKPRITLPRPRIGR